MCWSLCARIPTPDKTHEDARSLPNAPSTEIIAFGLCTRAEQHTPQNAVVPPAVAAAFFDATAVYPAESR